MLGNLDRTSDRQVEFLAFTEFLLCTSLAKGKLDHNNVPTPIIHSYGDTSMCVG